MFIFFDIFLLLPVFPTYLEMYNYNNYNIRGLILFTIICEFDKSNKYPTDKYRSNKNNLVWFFKCKLSGLNARLLHKSSPDRTQHMSYFLC